MITDELQPVSYRKHEDGYLVKFNDDREIFISPIAIIVAQRWLGLLNNKEALVAIARGYRKILLEKMKHGNVKN